jgi:hypothetical protein
VCPRCVYSDLCVVVVVADACGACVRVYPCRLSAERRPQVAFTNTNDNDVFRNFAVVYRI